MSEQKFIFGITQTRVKQFLSLGGLLFIGFLLVHFYGLAMIYAGDAVMDHHTEAFSKNPFLIFAEVGLVSIFLLHVFYATGVIISTGSIKTNKIKKWNLRTFMAYSARITGPIIFVFVLIHLYQYRMQKVEGISFAKEMHLDFYHNAVNTLFYIFCMAVLGMHLYQGLWAASVSWGLARTKKIQDLVDKLAMGFGFLMFLFPTVMVLWLFFIKMVEVVKETH